MVTYFICGLRLAAQATVTLAASSSYANPTPNLVIKSQRQSDQSVTGSAGSWSAVLGAGDHVLFVEGPDDDRWPGGTLSISATATLVTRKNPQILIAWPMGSGGTNPKDPWPPPGTPTTIGSTTWFNSTFSGFSVVLPRSM